MNCEPGGGGGRKALKAPAPGAPPPGERRSWRNGGFWFSSVSFFVLHPEKSDQPLFARASLVSPASTPRARTTAQIRNSVSFFLRDPPGLLHYRPLSRMSTGEERKLLLLSRARAQRVEWIEDVGGLCDEARVLRTVP